MEKKTQTVSNMPWRRIFKIVIIKVLVIKIWKIHMQDAVNVIDTPKYNRAK